MINTEVNLRAAVVYWHGTLHSDKVLAIIMHKL